MGHITLSEALAKRNTLRGKIRALWFYAQGKVEIPYLQGGVNGGLFGTIEGCLLVNHLSREQFARVREEWRLLPEDIRNSHLFTPKKGRVGCACGGLAYVVVPGA